MAPLKVFGAHLHAWGVPGFRSGALWKKVIGAASYVLILLLALATLRVPILTVVFLATAAVVVIQVCNFRNLRVRAGRHAFWIGPLAFLAGSTAFGSALPPQSAEQKADAAARVEAKATAAVETASRKAMATTSAAADRDAKAQATAQTKEAADAGKTALSAAGRVEAVELLGQALYKREEGNYGLAIELGRQAQAKSPDFAEASSFMAEVAPQATAVQATAVAQATASTRAAATAQAQANAQATAVQATAVAQATASTRAAAAAQAQAAVSATARANAARFIPGLTTADVKLNMERRGFRCNVLAGANSLSGLCQEPAPGLPTRNVSYIADSPTQVEHVSALIGNCPNALGAAAADLLGFVATLPYDGGNPTGARQWVEQQLARAPDRIGVHAETTIGGARFQIYGQACARGLSIRGLNAPH